MAKINTLFSTNKTTKKVMRMDSADAPSYRIDTVDRVDFMGGIVNIGEEVAWFNHMGDERKKYDYVPLEKNDEGFLLGRGVATTIGVFSYQQADGSIRRELRAPEHVYNPESVATLKMVPITNDHPTVAVTAENVDQFKVGNVGENVDADQMHGFISTSLSIQQKQAVQDVEGGKRGLSCGYTTDVVERSGVWGGMEFDAVQTNIRYNHLAIVDVGRAGDDAVMKMDGAMVIVKVIDPDPNTNNKHIKTKKKTKKGDSMEDEITLDGMTYKVPAHVKVAFDKAVSNATSAEAAKQKADTALETVTTEKEGIQGKLDAAEKEVKELTGKLDASVPKADIATFAAATKRIDDAVAKSKAVVVDGASDLDKKKAVILALDKDAKLDEAEEAYINGQFDYMCKKLDQLVKADETNTLVLKPSAATLKVKVDGEDQLTAEQKLDAKLAKKWENK
jgi:hypothetical protein